MRGPCGCAILDTYHIRNHTPGAVPMCSYATRHNRPTLLLLVLCGCILGLTRSAGVQTPPDPPPAAVLYLPEIQSPPPARILIAAAHIDSAISYEPDEAILLWN